IVRSLTEIFQSHPFLRDVMINGCFWMIKGTISLRGDIARDVSLSITTETDELLWKTIWVEPSRRKQDRPPDRKVASEYTQRINQFRKVTKINQAQVFNNPLTVRIRSPHRVQPFRQWPFVVRQTLSTNQSHLGVPKRFLNRG